MVHWLLWLSLQVLAAEPTPSVHLAHWTSADGLPQNSVKHLSQDEHGYLWLATLGGVARFDGVRFHRRDSDLLASKLGTRFVYAEHPSPEVLILATEEAGLVKVVDGVVNELTPGWPAHQVWRDGRGGFFVRSHQVLLWAQPDGDAWKVSQYPPPDPVQQWLPVPGGIVGRNSGWELHCLAGECPELPDLAELPDKERWGALSLDGSGRVVIGVPGGVMRVEDGEWKRVGQRAASDALGRLLLWRGQEWIVAGTELMRVADSSRYDLQGHFPQGIPSLSPLATLEDTEGGLWLGLDGWGVLRFDLAVAGLLAQPGRVGAIRSVDGVAAGSDGRLWSSACAGLWVSEGDVPDAVASLRCPEVWPDEDGDVLISGRASDGSEFRVFEVRGAEAPELQASFPGASAFVPPVLGRLVRVDGDLVEIAAHEQGSSLLVQRDAPHAGTAIRPSSRGGWWVALENGVLIEVMRGEAVRRVELNTTAVIRDVWEGPEKLWVATYGDGLFMVEPGGEPVRLGMAQGLCDNAVSHLFPDRQYLWFNSNAGLGRLLLDDARGGVRPVDCSMFATGEGNGSGGMRLSDGGFLLPTILGAGVFRPENENPDTSPVVRITAVEYAGRSYEGPRVEVEGPGDLSVDFVGLHFRAPTQVGYRHRVLGVMDEWSSVSAGQHLHFANLSPGIYTVQIQARGPSGVWSETQDLVLVRDPDFTERPMVRVFLPLSLLSLVLTVLGLGLSAALRQNRALREQVEERRRAVAALQAQEEQTRHIERLLAAQRRLESLGRLAGGVAHDFNNLLAVVSSHVALLQIRGGEDWAEDAHGLEQVVDRGASLTRQLVDFGRPTGIKTQVIDLAESVSSSISMLKRLVRRDIRIETELPPCGHVAIDPGRLDQIVTNLVLNSRDALSGPGTIRVRVGRDDEHGERCMFVEVSDDGPGIAPELLERVLEPYFTTKAPGEGSGLGLATVHGLVREANGEVVFDSAVGQGTRVTIWLPEVMSPAPVVEGMPETSPEASTSVELDARVLVVDDDASTRRAVVSMLRQCGAETLAASTEAEACAALEAGEVDVALVDVVMPSADGPAVVAAMRELRPGLPILYMSGHDMGLLSAEPDAQLLGKPFTLAELCGALRAVLDGGASGVDGASEGD